MQGHYAFVAMSLDEPETLVAARKECPLVVGRGEGEQFVGSDVPAFLAETRTVQYIESGEIVTLRPDGVTITTADGGRSSAPTRPSTGTPRPPRRAAIETFMLKEIHEQADAVADTIADRTARGDGVDLDEQGALDEAILAGVKRIVIVACGTSYHAGLIGRYAIEEWARMPVEMDIASEYRYRNPVVGPGDLVIGISQSGETADTLAAMRLARERGATVLAITNVMGSQVTRDSDGVLFTRAGLEIGVAATKTFVCQVAVIYLLGLRLAELRGTLEPERLAELMSEVKRLPHGIAEVARRRRGRQVAAHRRRALAERVLPLHRPPRRPAGRAGGRAEAQGDLLHRHRRLRRRGDEARPIALLDESTPVVCVATDSPVLEKLASNMQEVRARGAHVIALTTEGNAQIVEHADAAIAVPAIDWMLQPLLAVVPLQMLAYEIARRRGLNVDQPRNLAKTVTVE